MRFQNALSRFENCVAGRANNTDRLKTSWNLPLLLINHVSISNKNYQVALTVLKDEYLDEDEIIDNIFQDVVVFSSKREKSFSTLTELISKTASLLAELESSFNCTFSDDHFSGACLMVKILFSRFLREVEGELIRLSGKRIPTLSFIL